MSETKTWGIASMVTGILSLVLFLAPYFGLVFGIASIVFAGMQMKKTGNGFSTAGLVLGILGTALNFVTGLIFLVVVLNA